MSEPLLRLADQIDNHIPQFCILATVRWALFLFKPVLLSLSRRSFPVKHGYAIELYQICTKRLYRCVVMGWISLVVFIANDFWHNTDEITRCKPHTTARPMGVSAGVALICFVCTTKMSVSSMCIVSFLCVKERNFFAGIAVVLCAGVWVELELTPFLFLLSCILSAVHGTVCVSPSSAALSVASFTWICTWMWSCIFSRMVSETLRLLKKQ
jgi:hypothetical protein